jgi:molybdopterin-guanine dinucleotide biosynthesis protein A
MNLTAVLLAGGRSRRMGRDKAFMEIDGEVLWQRQLAKLEAVADEVLVSVRDTSSPIETVHRKVFDPPGARGPLAGLAGALHAATHAHVLVLAVDLPAMTPVFLRSLAARTSPGRGVVPLAEGFFQGTAAIYPREILPLVENALRGEDLSFQHLLRQAMAAQLMESLPVTAAELLLFANWNTPEAVPDSR